MKTPVISVLMSVYNGEQYLEESINSILHQTFQDFEFLIVDDGSIDQSANIIRRFKDKRIKLLVNKVNIGLTKSLNRGLLEAKGRFIARMDADDISEPLRLEKELDFLKKFSDYGAVGTFIKIFSQDSGKFYYQKKPVRNEEIRNFLKIDNCIAHGSAMIRKEAFEEDGFYNENIEQAQDYELWLRMSVKWKLANIPEYLYIWRDHKSNVSNIKQNEQKHFVELAKVLFHRKGKKVRKSGYKKPGFSVLMANYNNGKYIRDAINSILTQLFKEWELLILDDKSTDNSLDIIEPFLVDKRIKLLKNSINEGYVRSLKKLIYNSEADIFGILDSDDTIDSSALQIMVKKHNSNPEHGFIYSQHILCDLKMKPEEMGCCRHLPEGETNLRKNYSSAFRTFKKKYYFKTEGLDESILYAEDRDIIYKMEEVTRFLFVDKVLYEQRNLPHSQSNDPKKKKIGQISDILAKYKAYNRRKNMKIASLTSKEISIQCYHAAAISLRLFMVKRAAVFLYRSLKVHPFNPGGVLIFFKKLLEK